MRLENKNKDNISFVTILKALIPSAFKNYYIYTLAFLLLATFSGISIGLNTVVMQQFFDTVLSYINLNSTMKDVIISLVVLGAVVIGQQIIQGVMNFISNDLPLRIRGNVCGKLNLKSGKLNAIDFENPEFLDDINKAKVGLEYSIQLVLIFFLILTSYFPYFIFMGVYLYELKPILSVSIILVFIPVMLSQYLRTKIYADLEDASAPIRRSFGHYESCIISREYFKETRTLGAFKYFRKLYKESLEVLNKEIWKSEKKVFFIELLARLITLLGYISILILLVYSLIDKSISVGAFAAVHASIDTMFSMMDEVICSHIGSITQSVGTVKNYIRFLRLPEREGIKVEVKEQPEIIMNNVSFRYPLTNEDSIKNISLSIKKGETVAIVGENGAGKSTLIKLITGVYTPTEGDVFIDEVNTKDVDYSYFNKGISAIFQKFQKYKMKVGENIAISNELNINKDKIQSVMKKVDLDEKNFRYSLDTMLAKEFDGVDLSGGQWQRLSIARGLYKESNMIVLDEPTAAIDPLEESEIYNKFREISKDKTSLLVTHRLGSVKIAGKIIVMDKGTIIQQGTHNELISEEGKYKEMYESQSKWYVEDILSVQ